METVEDKPWFFQVEPLEGESISHFLGRFRRDNYLTPGELGKLAGIGWVVGRWEKFYLNPFPTRQELEALASIVGVEIERLYQMLPSQGVVMQPKPIRLCAVCYAENPYHRIEWQFKERWRCDRHQLHLLTKCTNCKRPFPIPALWVQGECSHCLLPFARMAKRQKSRRA
ncbi:TniQ family protein [Funiculus sociatus GB2-A5]|uniref:TniQ family protein n=1 Tax=Funiculus sociatus GB2-A5 TaxID=2933946 RepID=A0ABV0JY34_9CYAN|nr:TniQ family protein [Trichocoleus sp. FACHB-832]MBD2062835.1 TniQ family protein [Trichocoleus sp. FACHB-6]